MTHALGFTFRLVVVGLIAIAGALAFTARPAAADGLILPPPYYYGFETGQEAVIFQENGTQSMLLTTEFRGNAEDFAWLVPTPSVPEVTRGSWEMLVALRDITETPIEDQILGGYGAAPFAAESYVDRAAVQEIERKSIGYYEVVVLEARTTEGLLKWFKENGYEFPEDGTYVLDDYIQAGWYFTAAKLRTGASAAAARNITSGSSVPLLFQFATDKMVFPMQLSQVAQLYTAPVPKPEADSNTEALQPETGTVSEPDRPEIAPIEWYPQDSVGVTLYLLSTDRQSLPGFDQLYAGYISADAIRELSYSTTGAPTFSPQSEEPYVLTKLSRQFPVAEMTYDLYPRAEENVGLLNDERTDSDKMRSVWIIAGISGVLIIILVGAIILMTREPRQSSKND